MGENNAGGSLENVLWRLMEMQSGGDADTADTMLLLGLVDLLGIVSAMNRMSAAAPAPSSAGNPMLASLLQALNQFQGSTGNRDGESGGGMGGLNPALLLSMLNQSGGRPDQALLMGLLSSLLMQPPRPPKEPPHRERRMPAEPVCGRSTGKEAEAPSPKNGNREAPITWDRRLG